MLITFDTAFIGGWVAIMHSFMKTLEIGDCREIDSIQRLTSYMCENYFSIQLEESSNIKFCGKFKKVPLGCLNMIGCHTNSTINGIRRLSAISSDYKQDHCLVYLPIKMGDDGQSWHYQAGKQAKGGERIITIIDGSREYRVKRPTFLGLTLVIPLSLLKARIPRLDQYSVVPHDASKGDFAIVWDFIISTWYNYHNLSEDLKQYYGDIIINLLTTALKSENKICSATKSSVKLMYLKTALQYIDAHICNSTLGVDGLAKHLGIKKRYLHEIFQSHSTSVGSVIRKKRLECCYETLSDKAMDCLSLTEIAYRWGFFSYTHFSRIFKDEYGKSPKQVRLENAKKKVHKLLWKLEEEYL